MSSDQRPLGLRHVKLVRLGRERAERWIDAHQLENVSVLTTSQAVEAFVKSLAAAARATPRVTITRLVEVGEARICNLIAARCSGGKVSYFLDSSTLTRFELLAVVNRDLGARAWAEVTVNRLVETATSELGLEHRPKRKARPPAKGRLSNRP